MSTDEVTSIGDRPGTTLESPDSTRAPDLSEEPDPSEEPGLSEGPALSGMQVVASLGYPRDLLDRGRVNVQVTREDDTAFVILDKQLVADHFIPGPVEQRRTVLPPNGRTVALQTLFGEVDDCESTDPVMAMLVVTFTYGDDQTPRTASIPFTGTSTLDDIRASKCTVRQVLEENEIALVDPVVDGETMSVDLVIRRLSGESLLAFDSIKGTVLFGAATRFEPGSPERVLEPDETEAVIPIVIDVNRCDSHAVAETTRKFGIDLYVSVDGSESQLVPVAIDAIESGLEAMLDLCKERTGQ